LVAFLLIGAQRGIDAVRQIMRSFSIERTLNPHAFVSDDVAIATIDIAVGIVKCFITCRTCTQIVALNAALYYKRLMPIGGKEIDADNET